MKEIKAYLGNTLTPTEKEAFEKRMQEDSSLKKSVELALKDLMTNYFADELSESEKSQIDQRINQDSFFQNAYQAEVKLEKHADTASNMQYWLDTYSKVKDIYSENKEELYAIYTPSAQIVDMKEFVSKDNETAVNETRIRSVRWLKPIMYAAAACVLLLLALNLGRNRYASDSLAQKYFLGTGAPDAGITLGAETYESGLEAFDQKNYEEAINLLAQIPDTSAKYPVAQYLMGYAYMQKEDIKQAIDIYETIMQKGSNQSSPFYEYVERTRWFLSLSYLQTGQEENAKSMLQQIAEDKDHYKHEASVDLLSDLNHFLH